MQATIIDMFFMDGLLTVFCRDPKSVRRAFRELGDDMFELVDGHTIRVRPHKLDTFADCRRRLMKHIARFG